MFKPSSHVVEQWLGLGGADGAPFFGRAPLDLLLNAMECSNVFDGFGGDGRLMQLQDVDTTATYQAGPVLNTLGASRHGEPFAS